MRPDAGRHPPTVPAAYLGVIVIWSTTPLGIKWSTDAGFIFGSAARMLISTAILTLILIVSGRRLPGHAAALRSYVAATVGIYGAMMSVYWSAQWLPSGLMAVIFGLAPVITALFSAVFIGDRSGLAWKLAGGLIGAVGLWVIFRNDFALGEGAKLAMGAALFGASLYAASAVWIKREAAGLGAIEQATGGMLVSSVLYALTWLYAGERWPTLSDRTALSILYLAVLGSVVGFVWYFHLLSHLRPSTVTLVTLITPITALIIGYLFNGEVLPPPIWRGVMVVILGLFVYFIGARRPQRPAEPVP